MLKTVLYYLLLLTTAVRFVDMAYVLGTNSSDLPVPVLVVSAAMVLYGIFLLIRKFTSIIRLKQLMNFFMLQTLAIAFNLAYMALFCPLQIGLADTLIVGTFLDILVNSGIVYFCFKQMRGGYAVVTQSIH